MGKTKVTQIAPPTRKQLSRFQRDRMLQTYIWAVTVVVVVAVVGLVGYGLLDQYVLQQRQPVARVDGKEISTAAFQKNVRYRRFQMVNFYLQYGNDPQLAQFVGDQLQQIQSQLADPQGLGQQILDELVDDQLIRQEAARRGITVSAQELDTKMQEFFNYYPGGTATPTITPSPFPTDVLAPTAVKAVARSAGFETVRRRERLPAPVSSSPRIHPRRSEMGVRENVRRKLGRLECALIRAAV